VVLVNGQSPIPPWNATNVANDIYQDVLSALMIIDPALYKLDAEKTKNGVYSRGLTMLGFTN
jgi:hypothetical protein